MRAVRILYLKEAEGKRKERKKKRIIEEERKNEIGKFPERQSLPFSLLGDGATRQ
jgi:hypothetical protein